MLNTFGRAAVTLALTASLGGVTQAASATPQDNPYLPQWKVTHVGAGYTTYGKWKSCVTFSKDSTPHSVTCALSRTTSTTVSGTLTVSVKAVSAAVGYQVQKSYAVTGSETYTPQKNKSGSVRWRETYHTNKVTQTEYMCPLHGTCNYTNPVDTATVITRKYTSPNFSISYN